MKLRIGNDAIFKVAFMDGDELIETNSIKQINAWFVPKRINGCLVDSTMINDGYNGFLLNTRPSKYTAEGEVIIDNNDIYVRFRAEDQKHVGLYGLVITFTINCDNMVIEERTYTVDSCCDVELCPSSYCGCSTEGVFTDDIVVSLTGGKSFGKYVNGETVPAKGKTARQVIADALYESTSTVPTITNFALNINQSLTVGTNILAGTYSATFNTTNSSYITEIRLYDVTNSTIIQTLSGTSSPQTVTLSAVTGVAGQTQSYRLDAVYASGTIQSNVYTITWSSPIVTAPTVDTFSITGINSTTTSESITAGNYTMNCTVSNFTSNYSLALEYKKSTASTYTRLYLWDSVETTRTITLTALAFEIGESYTFRLAIYNTAGTTIGDYKTVVCTRVAVATTHNIYYAGTTGVPSTYDLSTYTSVEASSGNTYTTSTISTNTFVLAFPSTLTVSKIIDDAEIVSTWYDTSTSENSMSSTTGTVTYNNVTYNVWYLTQLVPSVTWDRHFIITFA